MSYYGHTYPFEHREGSDCDCGACQHDDWVEERHLKHLLRQEDDEECYCYGEADAAAVSLREVTPGYEEVQLELR